MTAYLVGAGMTRFGRFPDKSIRDLATEALEQAVRSAEISVKDIEAVFSSNAVAGTLTGQENIRGQVMLRGQDLNGVPIVNVENACASGSSALYLAVTAVNARQVDVALAIGAEKLTHQDKTRSLRAFETSLDIGDLPMLEKLINMTPADRGTRSLFMDLYAAGYADGSVGGTEFDERDLALVAVKNRTHASRNPYAQYRDLLTVEDVLASRRVAGKLRLFMCCPVGDGAAAVIVASEAWVKRRPRAAMRVAASVMQSGRGDDRTRPTAARRAAAAAYEQAGVQPSDLDFIEVHDAAAPAELHAYADLALCAEDVSVQRLRDGVTAIGGAQPVNPSGGLLSRGHPIGATGLAQACEAFVQLTGRAGDRQIEGARVGLTHNVGGFVGSDAAVAVVHVFERC